MLVSSLNTWKSINKVITNNNVENTEIKQNKRLNPNVTSQTGKGADERNVARSGQGDETTIKFRDYLHRTQWRSANQNLHGHESSP